MTPQFVYRITRALRLPKYEHLYVLFDPLRLPWRCKTGISCAGEIRKGQIQDSIKYHTGQRLQFRQFRVPVLFARHNERFVHWVFRKIGMQNREFSGTDGGTEHFYSINILTFVFTWLLLAWFGAEAPHWKAALLLVVPFPLDHILLICILALLQYAVVLGALWWMVGVVIF